MSYAQLTALLDSTQFAQMKVVRDHLLQDPTTLDKVEETEDGHTQEAVGE